MYDLRFLPEVEDDVIVGYSWYEEKAKGLAAKDRVKQLLAGCENITLVSHGVGKFGRCLGEIFLDTIDGQEKLTVESLNELLIREGHAVEYHGGKR